jgi:hypothetical protein
MSPLLSRSTASSEASRFGNRLIVLLDVIIMIVPIKQNTGLEFASFRSTLTDTVCVYDPCM